jgi:thiol-disulfide isomerase/thioredoxin
MKGVKGPLPFLLVMFVIVFVAGFIIGYFTERTGMVYTQSEIDRLRSQVDDMQLQEMFITGEKMDCRLMYSTMGSLSYNLYDMVARLKSTSPDTQQFYDMKRQADFLSLKAWMVAKNIREQCTSDIVPVLYVYSGSCPECDRQDTALQSLKSKYPGLLVYAIDYYLDEPAIKLVKDAYEIKSTPSMIIDHRLYGPLDEAGLEAVICGNINCTVSSS